MACMRDHFDSGVVLEGRYQTIAPLNHGSFGMVFMARQLETGETVAIKCLTKRSAESEAGLDFAIDDKSEELVLHRHLGRHPNIVNLIESFETDSHSYLVLEFCPRGDLYEAIRNGQGPLETEHVRRFMLELIDAVDYIHSKGIYHRDIKPENIFLSQSGSLKLGDFGLSTTDKWTYEATVGSDRYMAPEQFDSAGAGYSPAQADIWAIGICLLNILFSRNPFTTPTEADPLFLDFSRDKQSLFDVFPSMSQDTYEVIVECMNLDPSKRSLVGARNALLRLVSFTTLDEALDDFCSTDRRVVASANREPLRTPSIQSPQVDTGSFPWAKAFQTANRQLSAIPDDESYTEELFSKSEATASDWCSAMTAQTPSSSMLDSSLGASIKSLKMPFTSTVSPMAGSLPIAMSRNRHTPSMSLVFGRKDGVSKSWSDLWDEEEEEEEERRRQLEALKKNNARTYSQEGDVSAKANKITALVDEDATPRQGLSPATKALSIETFDVAEPAIAVPAHDDFIDEVLFFSDPLEEKREPARVEELAVRYLEPASPPKSPSTFDKWKALGERRRAYTGSSSASVSASASLESLHANLDKDNSTFGYGSTHAAHGSSWDHSTLAPHSVVDNHKVIHQQPDVSSNHSPGQNKWNAGKDRTKECPWNKGRYWNWGWRREKRPDFSNVAWVGGWQEARS